LNPSGFCTRLDTVLAVGSVQKTVPDQPETLDCSFSELGSTQTSDHSLLWVTLRSRDEIRFVLWCLLLSCIG